MEVGYIRGTLLFLVAFLAGIARANDMIPLEIPQSLHENIIGNAFLVDASGLELPANNSELMALISQYQELNQVSTTGSKYWYVFQTAADVETLLWFNISNRLLNHIRLYSATDDKFMLLGETGLRHPPQYPLTYAQQFTAPEGLATWVIEVEHPYISGNPHVWVSDEQTFKKRSQYNLLIVIGCIGTILLLAPYNLLIGIWSRSAAYYWYSAYLLAVAMQWMTFFNIWDHFFGIRSDFYNFTFFNLYVFFGTNFYLTFLKIDKKHRFLIGMSKLWRYSLLMVPGYFIWPPYVHYTLLNIVVGGWIFLGLASGIVSYVEGYRPARFFIAGFSLIFAMALVTILGQAHVISGLDNTYRWALVAQTLDVILLSLALADQINTLRKERIHALMQSFNQEKKAREIEETAAKTLAEANTKLDTALAIANQDREDKHRYMRLIGHELKTPLHTVLAILDSVEDGAPLGHDERSQLASATVTLKRHIFNLLSLSETSSGSLAPLNALVDIEQLLSGIVLEIQKQFDGEAPVVITGEGSLPERIVTDEILLRHLVFELLHNAVKYSSGKPVYVRLSYANSTLSIQIEDQAGGFPSGLVAEYTQFDNSLSRKNDGLGIGLTVATNLLEVLGSKLVLDHPRENCTVVSFDIEAPKANSLTDYQANNVKKNCLVVEDNLFNQKLLIKILTRLGHSASGAENGKVALEKANQEAFDIVFMDLQMPVMDGIEATRRLRNSGYLNPVVAVTANTEYETRVQVKNAGADKIIGKPISLHSIQSIIQEVIAQ